MSFSSAAGSTRWLAGCRKGVIGHQEGVVKLSSETTVVDGAKPGRQARAVPRRPAPGEAASGGPPKSLGPDQGHPTVR